ncbi:hypothetical protein I2483_13640 [Sporosarcina sp. E16_3]|uniref:hypothetical protein n=1 Tax=Sporosarcina sp. E16_3 TaxID=2789293 RepID=UPI001A937789|nr:hypothetical protein [Sporosarcina sp. E16_3]MBO0602705.1 hypothetical protein [Sporosarcina sp. E16_3]
MKSIGAVFNSQPIGSIVDMTQAEADHYVKLGLVEPIKETPKPAPKAKVSKDK